MKMKNLHQPKSLFFREAFALTFQPEMPSGLRIMLLYTVEEKQVNRAKTPLKEREEIRTFMVEKEIRNF